MNEVGTLSLNECDITNKDIIVTYVPQTFVTSYQYIIYKDSVEQNVITVSNNKSTDIKFDETGNYQIKIIAYHNNGYSTYTTGTYQIDKESPIIDISQKTVNLDLGDHYNIYSNIIVKDNIDGDITKSVSTNIDSLNLNSFGKKKLVYTVSDKIGRASCRERV